MGAESLRARPGDHPRGRERLPQGRQAVEVVAVGMRDDQDIRPDAEGFELTDHEVPRGRHPRLDQGRAGRSPDEIQIEEGVPQDPQAVGQTSRDFRLRR
jgi:hypothetical protein